MRRLMFSAAALWLVVALGIAASEAAPGSDAIDPAKASVAIVEQFARADLDALATEVGKYMSAEVARKIKNNFAQLKDLGNSQYTELVYFREYGEKEKDIIYKVDFDKAFTYIRMLWHIDNGKWSLVNISYNTENDLPFPKGWEHIYPK